MRGQQLGNAGEELMSSAKQNSSIARLIVGAMTIDGNLSKEERDKVARSLEKLGVGELVADVGAAIEEDDGNFNMFEECKQLIVSLGADAKELAPLVFRVVADVVASDRFVSSREAIYLSALAKRLELTTAMAQTILKQVMAERRGRLEVAASGINEVINPQLKELLSFSGAEKMVGELDHDSIEELMNSATDALNEGQTISRDDLARALTILGLHGNAKLGDAQEVWRETIDNLNLPKMAGLGETFVSAAINRISRINEAYKTVLQFHQRLGQKKAA